MKFEKVKEIDGFSIFKLQVRKTCHKIYYGSVYVQTYNKLKEAERWIELYGIAYKERTGCE